MTKKPLPLNLYRRFVAENFLDTYIEAEDCENFDLNGFTHSGAFRLYYITKEQIENILENLEKCNFRKFNSIHYKKDGSITNSDIWRVRIDECLGLISNVALLVNNCFEFDELTTAEKWEIFKRVLHLFVKYTELSRRLIDEYNKSPGNNLRKVRNPLEDYESDEYYTKIFGLLFSKYFSNSEEYLTEVENFIDNNFESFCSSVHHNSCDITMKPKLQKYWITCIPLSNNFIKKHCENINLYDVLKNKQIVYRDGNNIEFLFRTLLAENINEIMEKFALGAKTVHKLTLTDEQIKQYALLFALEEVI